MDEERREDQEVQEVQPEIEHDQAPAPEVEAEPVKTEFAAFEALKDRFNALKDGELQDNVNDVIEDLKRMGYEVKEKGKEYAKKLGESGEAYKNRAKLKADDMRRRSRMDELIYQIGEAAYDGHKSGEDVQAVLEYLYKKLDRLEAEAPKPPKPPMPPMPPQGGPGMPPPEGAPEPPAPPAE